MRSYITSVTVLAAVLSKHAVAKIDFGIAEYDNRDHRDYATWVDGEDACQYTYIGSRYGNPCEYNSGLFVLPNGTDYQLINCPSDGISNSTLTEVDTTNAWCERFDQYYNAASGCENQYGTYFVNQWWSFG